MLILVRFRRDCVGTYTEEREDERYGPGAGSLAAGDILRDEGAVLNEDDVEADSICWRELWFWVTGLWLVEGRRNSTFAAGDTERGAGEAMLLKAFNVMDWRCALFDFCSK